jgi:hypothetical protein
MNRVPSATIALELEVGSGVQNTRNGLVIVCGLAAMLLSGCQNDEIRSYRVAKPEAKPATRLLAMIIPHGDRTWFFKLVGPVAQIDEQKAVFDQFIRSVRFTDQAERPITWTVPNGWLTGPESKLRYATFYLGPREHPMELTVFEFSGAAGSVLANVNRWRGQIGLTDIQESELGQLSRSLQLECGPATLVDMTNRGGGNAAAVTAPDILSRRSGSRPQLQYDKPGDWKEKPDPKGIRVVVFEIADGAVEAGITALSGSAGGLLANVNRWRGQIHLGQVDEEQLHKELRQIDVAGTTAPYVDLIGPESAGGSPQRILGAVLPRGGQTWFFTLRGPAEQVEKQKPAFEAFLKSVRFGG